MKRMHCCWPRPLLASALGASLVRAVGAGDQLRRQRRPHLAAVLRRGGRRGDEFARPAVRVRAHRSRRRHARRRAHVLSRRLAHLSVRPDRQVRQGNRPGRLRDQLRAASARGSAGQHLDRRRRIESGREVRSRRALSAGARPEAREHRAASGARRAGERADAACRRAARRPPKAVAAVAVAVAAAAAALPAPESTATASTGPRTSPGTAPATSTLPTVSARTTASRSSTRTATS